MKSASSSKKKETTPPQPMGRPMKGKDRRMPIGVYVAGSVINAIEEYVAERQLTQRAYSRSDFINEAIEKHMKNLGMIEGGDVEKKQG